MNRLPKWQTIAPDVKDAYKRQWKEKNPGANTAHTKVRNAIKNGSLRRGDMCDDCNKSGKLQAHHHSGYLPPHEIDVIWLCGSCHKKRDLQKRTQRQAQQQVELPQAA